MIEEIRMLWFYLQARLEPVRENRERGDIVQTAIMVGLFAAGAIGVVAVLVGKADEAAQKIKP